MTRTQRDLRPALRRGIVAGVLGAALAVAGPARAGSAVDGSEAAQLPSGTLMSCRLRASTSCPPN